MAIVKLPDGTTFKLREFGGLLEYHSVLGAVLCGNLRDEIGYLSQEETHKFYDGIDAAYKLFFQTLQERYNKMSVGDEARFSSYFFWGKKHSDIADVARKNIRELLNADFDWERDIVFIFCWPDRNKTIARIIYRVPDEVLATKNHLDELEKLHEEVQKLAKKKLYRVKVWEADKDYDTEYEDVEEVHWDAVNKVVDLKLNGATFHICAKKVCFWEE